MKSLRIAVELKIISFLTVALVGYFFTKSVMTAMGIVLVETAISLLIQTIWLKRVHKI